MECWVCRQALGAVCSPFTGDHPFAEQHLGTLHRAFFDEIVVLYDQHFADVLRMIQENNVVRTDLVVRNIAVGLGEMLKEKMGSPGRNWRNAATKICAGNWGENGSDEQLARSPRPRVAAPLMPYLIVYRSVAPRQRGSQLYFCCNRSFLQ